MKFIKKNIKLILGITIGLVISVPVVYATGTILFQSSAVSFDNTRARLTKQNGDEVETVEEAIEALARNSGGSSGGSCSNSPFQLGDYVSMTPDGEAFIPNSTYTNETQTNSLTPAYLNVWRVIRINPDCTVEMVSEYASDEGVYFKGKVGYQNYIYYLNEIAKHYANTTYTLDPATAPDGAFRNVGYDGQTKQITNTTRLNDSSLGSSSGAWYKKTSGMGIEEELGGGDFKYITDLVLMENAGVGITAYRKTSTDIPTIFDASLISYWIASRNFHWSSETGWYYSLRYVSSDGSIENQAVYYWRTSTFYISSTPNPVRPIVTLKSNVTHSSGSGTSASPYQLSVS